MVAVRNALSFAKTVVAGIQQKNVPFMAASIAYQAFISLIPLLVLVFVLVSVVGDEQLTASVVEATEGVLPESGQLLLEDAIDGASGATGTSVIGLVVLLWGSLKIFRGLDTAFSEIYGSTGEASFVSQLRDAIVVFGAIGLALVAAGAASIVFAFFPDSLFVGLLNPLLLVVGLTLAFIPMFYYFPDADVSVRDVLPGAVVAAVGWAILQSLFQVYVAFAGESESAGPVGAILLVLTWLYFGGMLLLVGGVVSAASSGRLELDEDGEGTAGRRESAASSGRVARSPGVDRIERERDQFADRAETLERERNQLRTDLGAQRKRRYRLEDRVDRLETTTRELEAENERLRRELETRRGPAWRRTLRTILTRVQRVSVGTVKRE